MLYPPHSLQTSKLSDDLVNFDQGPHLTMTVQNSIAFSSLLLKDEDFITFIVRNNRRHHLCTFEIRHADFGVFVHGQKENLIQLQLRSGIALEFWRNYLLIFRHSKLFTGDIHDGVHAIFSPKWVLFFTKKPTNILNFALIVKS